MEIDVGQYLIARAREVAEPYIALSTTRAVIVTGSAVTGSADRYSDIDIILYHNSLPSEEDLQAWRQSMGNPELLWEISDRPNGSLVEAYLVKGIECQFGHSTIALWERDMSDVLERLDYQSNVQKALYGLLHCVPIHGCELVSKWQDIARQYPEPLARKMVEENLDIPALWKFVGGLETRNASIWMYDMLVEGSYKLLSILAGLNRVYFCTFQLKRLDAVSQGFKLAPPDFQARLERVFAGSLQEGMEQFRDLVSETLDLVEAEYPDMDTAALRRKLGARPIVWDYEH